MSASSGAIRAGRAFVELFADDSKLVRVLGGAKKRLQNFGAGVTSAGLGMVGLGSSLLAPLAAATLSFANAGSRLDDMSQRTGQSVESLSALEHAAVMSGTSLEALEGGIRKVGGKIVEAASGSKTAIKSFTDLGLSWRELSTMGADEQLGAIGDKLQAIENPAERTAAAMDLFGKAGAELVPLLSEGSSGLAKFRAEAERLGIVMSGEDATAAAGLGDAIDNLKASASGIVNTIGAAIAPALTGVVENVTTLIVAISNWVKENRALVLMIAQVAAGVVAAGAVLVVIGTIIYGVGAACGVLAALVTGIGTAFGILTAVVGAILSPIGLVSVAVIGLAAYLLYATGAGSAAMEGLGQAFGSLREIATEAFGGIADALAAGDLTLAAKILWLSLQLIFRQGVHALNEVWVGAKSFFVETWASAVDALAVMFTNAWAGIQTGWESFLGSFMSGWLTAESVIAKGSVRLKALFDDSINVELLDGIIDSAFQIAQAKTESDRAKRVKDIEQQRQGANEELSAQSARDRAAREDANAASLRGTQQAVEDAKNEFAKARADAAAAAAGKPKFGGNDPLKLPDLQTLATKTASVAGTFSATAAGQLGADGPAQRTASATEATAKNTKKLLDQNNNTAGP